MSGRWRGPRGRSGRRVVHDIVTPTDRERAAADVARRQRRYLTVMLPCVALVVLALLAPLPAGLRLALLVGAALLGPMAVLAANDRRR